MRTAASFTHYIVDRPCCASSTAGLGTAKLAAACARLRPGADAGDPVTGTKLALRNLARRWQALDAEVKDLDARLTTLITRARPDLLEIRGVGPEPPPSS